MPLSRQTLESLYQTMVRIRRFDERTVELFNSGQVKGTAHSYVGQEAVATGACAHLHQGRLRHQQSSRPRPLHRQGGPPRSHDGRAHGTRGRLLPRPGRVHAHRRPRSQHAGCQRHRGRGGAHRSGGGPRQQAPESRSRGHLVLWRRRGEPGRGARDHEPRRGVEAPLHLRVREQQVRAQHRPVAHDSGRGGVGARPRLRYSRRARGRQRPARRARGGGGGGGPRPPRRGAELRGGRHLPLGRPQHARQSARVPHQAGRARVDREGSRGARGAAAHGHGSERARHEGAAPARGGRARRRRGLREREPRADRGGDGGRGVRAARARDGAREPRGERADLRGSAQRRPARRDGAGRARLPHGRGRGADRRHLPGVQGIARPLRRGSRARHARSRSRPSWAWGWERRWRGCGPSWRSRSGTSSP